VHDKLGTRVWHEYDAGAECTGDESRDAEDGVIYFAATLIVELNSAWARRHQLLAHYQYIQKA
jgi:hypothetical protein